MELKEALKIAIEAEEKAMDRYHGMAREAEDPEIRLLFEQLAREEEGHWKRLSDRLKAIKLLG